ncbi:uncharacterized protein LOC117646289 [Thrips palmi]|uniref:Uncharacterized protein LOC117646289 n=1 Tax=Thrips palmi TaxID=161013 RepID=A0A6P8Z7Z4_THRPL|nr:uncharacterized protein LOC117646289 [Thrips palmi]
MFAAAGGASLAKRQARRNVRNKQHAHTHVNVELHPHPPVPRGAPSHLQVQHLQPRFSTASAHHLYRAPSHRRLSSYADLKADLNGRIVGFGSIELAEGKAAWQERERERDRERDRERRSSACEAGINHRVKSTEARRRWMRRNRIHDTAYGGSSSDEDEVPFPFGHESAAANALLYVGLGTVAVGMVIAFVGTGEKGFKTLELRLIGPTLIAGGVLCCLLRVMLCVCPSRCLLKRFRQRSRHKKQVLALEAAGRIAMGPMGRNMPPRHSSHAGHAHKGQSRPSSRASRPGSRTGSRTCSRTGSRLSRTQSELIRSPSDPNDPSVSGGARGKKRVSIASGCGPCGPGVAGGSGVGAGVHRPGSGVPASQSSQVLAATSLFLQNEQQASRSGSGRAGLGFTVPSINLPSLPSLVRGRSEDLGEGYVASSVRRLSQSSKRLGSTGDLPLLSAVDIDGDLDDLDGAYSYNSGFSPDDAQPGPSYAAPSTSHVHVHAPHSIIVTSPTPSSSPRPPRPSTARPAPALSNSSFISSEFTVRTAKALNISPWMLISGKALNLDSNLQTELTKIMNNTTNFIAEYNANTTQNYLLQ